MYLFLFAIQPDYLIAETITKIVDTYYRGELDLIINTYFDSHRFDVLINGDDFEGKGKPDQGPFYAPTEKLKNLMPFIDIIIVENAPLGVKAANAANINCIVALNTSPLTLSDFNCLIDKDRIFKNTKSAAGIFLNIGLNVNKRSFWRFH